jgi:hypothetical protein
LLEKIREGGHKPSRGAVEHRSGLAQQTLLMLIAPWKGKTLPTTGRKMTAATTQRIAQDSDLQSLPRNRRGIIMSADSLVFFAQNYLPSARQT